LKQFIKIANRYIDDVLNGVIPACQYVKQACQRQKDDLANPPAGYQFDQARAIRPCLFIELLPHIKGEWRGQNIELVPAQIFVITTIFGWIDDNGYRRFKTAYIEWPRKNAKSTLSCGIALYCMLADGEGGPEIYSAATTRDQARIVFNDAAAMVRESKDLREAFDVQVGGKTINNNIFSLKNGSVFKPLSRDQGGNLDGLNVHCGVIDELHAHKTRDVFDVIETATGARRQPLLWLITTAGFNRAGICYEQRAYTIKLLSKVHDDPEYFGIIYTIDGPSKDIVQSSKAISMIGGICECHNVRNTQILKLLLEECVNLVTTHGIKKTNRYMQQNASIQTGELEQEVYAHLAMNNSCLIEILKERGKDYSIKESGLKETQKREKKLLTNGLQSQEVNIRDCRVRENQNTGLAQTNLNQDILPSKESALFVEMIRIGKLSALITAIKRVLLEVYCVEDVIQESAFSKIALSLLEMHSVTCPVNKKVKLSSNNKFEISTEGDDWTQPEAWEKANPLWGVSVNPEDIARKARKAIETPSATNNFLTKHLNVWVNASTAWMNMQKWQSCGDTAMRIEDYKDWDCWLGLDLASKLDIAAKIYIFRRDDDYRLFSTFWLPEETVMNSANSQYSGWVREGYLLETDGATIDYNAIQDSIIEDFKRFNVQECCFDPFQATQMSGNLIDEGLTMVEIRPTILNFSEPMKTLEELIINGNLKHDGNPAMEWMISNVVCKRDAKDNIYPNKEFPENKIDGPVAAIMALSRAIVAESNFHDSIYNYGEL